MPHIRWLRFCYHTKSILEPWLASPYQPSLRPALPCVYGPLEYREQRALFERIDGILSASGLKQDFIDLALTDRKIDTAATSARLLERFARFSVLALRANIARILTGLGHRDFCARLADSPLLQWFLHVGQIDSIKTFSKSSSDRFGQWVSEESLRVINQKFTALLAATAADNGTSQPPSATFGLPDPISYDDIYFDSTCLKADIHFPTDWVLLRDAARTLMKATVLIRKHGLKNRMPQEPLEFLSEAQAQQIIDRMEGVLDQLPTAIKQAHERMIGGRRIANDYKILSLYDDSVNVIVRGKAGANVEFGNKLWLGENRDGIIVDYKLYQDNPSDSTLAKPALERLLDDQKLEVKQVWGDRGLTSKVNSAMLERRKVGDGFCPRDVTELSHRLANEEGFRDGLKRRAGTEARIGIFKNVFLGRPLLARGFKHRELAVGWATLTHNLWVVARMAEAEKKRKEDQEQNTRLPEALAA